MSASLAVGLFGSGAGIIAGLWFYIVAQKAKATAKDATAALQAEAAAHAATEARRRSAEAVVKALGSEISRLEADIETCTDPVAVRSRLRGLLRDPWAEADPAGGRLP